jgi:hypothetical protein
LNSRLPRQQLYHFSNAPSLKAFLGVIIKIEMSSGEGKEWD